VIHIHKRFAGLLLVLIAPLTTTAPAAAQRFEPVSILAAVVQAERAEFVAMAAMVGPEIFEITDVLERPTSRTVPSWILTPVHDDLRRRRSELGHLVRRAELEYLARLGDLARLLTPDPRLAEEWAALPDDRLTVVIQALSRHGIGYRSGASGPNSYDCSGFTRVVLATVGVDVPHKAAWQQQVLAPTAGAPRPGDLVFFAGGSTAAGPLDIGHVGIYLGAGLLVHSNSSDNAVAVDPVGAVENRVAVADPFSR
jgi:hypothetical protein